MEVAEAWEGGSKQARLRNWGLTYISCKSLASRFKTSKTKKWLGAGISMVPGSKQARLRNYLTFGRDAVTTPFKTSKTKKLHQHVRALPEQPVQNKQD